MNTTISIWKTSLFNAEGKQISVQTNKNVLHLEGERYILSAAFLTGLSGFGVAPENLYIGLDSRPKLFRSDTLADVAGREPKAEEYRRIKISTKDGYSAALETPTQETDQYGEENQRIFTLRGSFSMKALADYGTINNYSLSTASEGTNGHLIISSPLEHAFEMWEGYSIAVESIITLRAALLV